MRIIKCQALFVLNFCFCGVLNSTLLYSQNQHNIDSIYKIYRVTTIDTVKINLLNGLATEFEDFNQDSSIYYANKANEFSKRIHFKRGIAFSYEKLGMAYWIKGFNVESLVNYKKSQDVYSSFGDLNSEGRIYKRIGNLYLVQNLTNQSIENYLKAINIFQKLNKKRDLAGTCNNAGVILMRDSSTRYNALVFFQRALKIGVQIEDKFLIENTSYFISDFYVKSKQYDYALNMLRKIYKTTDDPTDCMLKICGVLMDQGSYKYAIENYNKLLLTLDKNSKVKIAQCYFGLAEVYNSLNNFTKALSYYRKAEKIYRDKGILLYLEYNKLGNFFLKNKKYKEAQYYFEKGLISSSSKDGDLAAIKESYINLVKVDSASNNFKNAFEHLKQVNNFSDSINKNIQLKKLAGVLLKIEFDKRLEADSIKVNSEKRILTANIEKQKAQRNAFIGGFVLIMIIAIGIFYSLLQNKKAKRIISKQKEFVEEKNREILDSIEYAKRIQATILPSVRVVKKYLEDSFILYLPKDIVAGDFYWMESIADEPTVYFAACDCTGHGVPGAMVSVVCHNALNKALKEFGKRTPAEILDKVAEMVIEDFNKNADEDDEVKDGMDASLCSLNVETGQLQWAGANNALWIIKTNGILHEYKPDKQPVGKSYDRIPFTNHQIQLEKGDTLFLFTDGYADQFGGTNNRKFQRKTFKELLVSIHQQTMEQQREAIYNRFENWRGPNEQVDDVCVIGVRV